MNLIEVLVHSDGGARGNPGPAAAGIFLEIPAENLRLLRGKYLGDNTNNYAEYQGVILGLKTLQEILGEKTLQTQVKFFLDSSLIVNQLNGLFRLKALNLSELFSEVRQLEKNFSVVSYQHVPREKNKEADKAVNQSLDKRGDFKQIK